jgi:hypothetical protein
MSNLSHQFDGQQEAWEDIQRRRYARKKGVSGFIGNGYWLFNYPNMIGGIGSGTILQTHSEQYENPVQELGENMGHGAENAEGMAGTSTGMGEGGTAATGATGGAPA